MKSKKKLVTEETQPQLLKADEIEAMWLLYSSSYENVRKEVFLKDLMEKNRVFVSRDCVSKQVKGFSTAAIYDHEHEGRKVRIYFSGDTMISPEYWGTRSFHRAVLFRLLKEAVMNPFRPVYWFLICSGYRTYLSMARNIAEHWPHFQKPTPKWEKGLIDSLSAKRFGKDFVADRGVIRTEGVIVKTSIAPFTAEVMKIPEVQFFVRANPGYLQGDELAMIGKISLWGGFQIVKKWVDRFVMSNIDAFLPPKVLRPKPAFVITLAVLSLFQII
ncbi:MAG: hypothetical protein JNL01_00250 [Bdellovibrionales bacterium]|nr:hypothetical protein [Bdellovibrionales bacterium]